MKAGAIDYLVKEKGFIEHVPLAVEAAFKRMNINRRLEKATFSLKRSLEKQKNLTSAFRRRMKPLLRKRPRLKNCFKTFFLKE
jgi:hypothetical protein